MDKPFDSYAETPTFARALAEIVQEHAVGRHVCLIGERGSGKSVLASVFATRLGYKSETFSLYADMSARELLQSRGTTQDGSTVWHDSPLLRAALSGDVCILDGVHRMPAEVLAVLQRLLVDGECELHDGRRILSATHAHAPGVEGEEFLRIHPSFRVIALAEAPTKKTPWLQPSTLEQFSFVSLGHLEAAETSQLLSTKFPSLPASTIELIVNFREALQNPPGDGDLSVNSGPRATLTQRQMIRLCRHMLGAPEGDDAGVRLALETRNMMMADFQPAAQRAVIAQAMQDVLLRGAASESAHSSIDSLATPDPSIVVDGGVLRIGSASAPIDLKPDRPELVPRPRFYDNPRHTRVLEGLLNDHVREGERGLLLIGNQGVGKNKLADRLLQLLGRPREYIQLHRDTTVQTLTLAPSLQDGVVVWADSPLVKAVEHGRVLLVDEADKAPLEVVVVLKSLLEDGEMRLGDGRRCLSPEKMARELSISGGAASDNDIIPIHPDFRMWVLANRPGFPFHGNNFFKECGDIFSIHTVHNPDVPSELELLHSYAPDVSQSVAKKLTAVFQDLRDLEQAGDLTYPYSSRELVAVVRHLQAFPTDGVVGALENVLAFDTFSPHVRSQIADVCVAHGIPVDDFDVSTMAIEDIAEDASLPPLALSQIWKPSHSSSKPSSTATSGARRSFSTHIPRREFSTSASSLHSLECEVSTTPLRFERWQPGGAVTGKFRPDDSRIRRFSEEKKHWNVPRRGIKQSAVALAALVSTNQAIHDPDSLGTHSLHCLSTSPMGIHSYFSTPKSDSEDDAVAFAASADADDRVAISKFVATSLDGRDEDNEDSRLAAAKPPSTSDDATGSMSQHKELWKDGRYQFIDVPLGRFIDADDELPCMAAVDTLSRPAHDHRWSRRRGGQQRQNGNSHSEIERRSELSLFLPSMSTVLFIDPNDSERAWSTLRLPEILPVLDIEGGVERDNDSKADSDLTDWIAKKLGMDNRHDRSEVATAGAQIHMQVLPCGNKDQASKLLLSRPHSDTIVVLDLGRTIDSSGGTSITDPALHEIVLPTAVAEAGGLRALHTLDTEWLLVEDFCGNTYYANIDLSDTVKEGKSPSQKMTTVKRPDGTILRMGPAAARGLGGRQGSKSGSNNADGRASAAPRVRLFPVQREDFGKAKQASPGENDRVTSSPLNLQPIRGHAMTSPPPHATHDPRGHSSRLVISNPLEHHIQQLNSLPIHPGRDAVGAVRRSPEQELLSSQRQSPVASAATGSGDDASPMACFGSWHCAGNGGTLVTAFGTAADAPSDSPDFGRQVLEVLSLESLTSRMITVPPTVDLSDSKRAQHETRNTYDPIVDVVELPLESEDNDRVAADIFSVQKSGLIRQWQVDSEGMARDRQVWREMFGITGDELSSEAWAKRRGRGTKSNKLKYDLGPNRTSVPRTGVSAPKHGKEDNKPHVGGNTWAGGTGGSDTAGLGGRGGPYRLDKGHPIHQISDEDKRNVPEEVRQRAGEMAREALANRLDAINMSTHQSEVYERIRSGVDREIHQLRSVLEAAQMRENERIWLKNQTSGELDDAKLVDGVTGERNIYKRRGEADTQFGAPTHKKKLLTFVVDISGSMYYFNGKDGRLDRMLETSVMMMEALRGLEDKFDYNIVGHSGDGPEIPLVEAGKPPSNEMEQLKIVETMMAHSQFCWSGDYTVDALAHSIRQLRAADESVYAERYAFLVSDANLRRYGISPHELAAHMSEGGEAADDAAIRSYAIFLASIGDEADQIKRGLPRGRGFTCFDTTALPALFRSIFTAEFGSDLL